MSLKLTYFEFDELRRLTNVSSGVFNVRLCNIIMKEYKMDDRLILETILDEMKKSPAYAGDYILSMVQSDYYKWLSFTMRKINFLTALLALNINLPWREIAKCVVMANELSWTRSIFRTLWCGKRIMFLLSFAFEIDPDEQIVFFEVIKPFLTELVQNVEHFVETEFEDVPIVLQPYIQTANDKLYYIKNFLSVYSHINETEIEVSRIHRLAQMAIESIHSRHKYEAISLDLEKQVLMLLNKCI